MPIASTDILLRESGASGLGGAAGSVVPAGFATVTGSEAVAGSTKYRCVYVRNNHATLTLSAAKIWLSGNTPSTSTDVAIGLGVSAIGGVEPAVATTSIAPPGVTFGNPSSDAAALLLGDLGPGQHRAVWERRTVTAGAAALDQDTYERTVAGDTVDTARTAATLRALWTGVPTPDGVVISSRLNSENTASSVRVAVSTSAALTSPVYSSAMTPDATYRITKHVLTGLQPNTEYFYAIEVDGQIDPRAYGRFRTLPPVGAAANFRIAVGGCSSNANDDAFAAINALPSRPLFLLALGDFQYMDAPTPSMGSYQGAFDVSFARPVRNLTHRQVPTVYMWDDHDFANDESTGRDSTNVAKSWRGNSTSFFRQRVPAVPASSTVSDTVHYSFVVGRVRFIISDLRADKTSQVATDDSAKTMMGAAQKAWFKSQITAAAAAAQVVAWANSVPWVQGTSATSDAWGGYTTERTELANHIASVGMGGRVMILSSDMHALAICKGIDYATGGGAMIPVFQAGPFNKIPSSKGGPYDFGPYPVPGGATAQQYGTMDVTDDGTNMTVTWRGYSADGTERMAYTFVPAQMSPPQEPSTPPATAPAQMSAPTATAGTQQATVTLQAPSNGGAAIIGYDVVSSPAGGVDDATDRLSLVRTITGLQAGVAYQFSATATNSVGTSTASPLSTAVTPAAPYVPPATSTFEATGGTVTTPGDGYKYWTFLANDTLVVSTAGSAEVIAVGGGGPGASGNSSANGGGGNGGVIHETMTIPGGSHAVVIGVGGVGTTANSAAKGTSTKLGTLLEALPGGVGASSNAPASTGGGAGGGSSGNLAAVAGNGTQGKAGGAGYAGSTQAQRSGGGGGGAGSDGVAGVVEKGGDGGEGIDAWGRRVAGGGGGSSQGATQGAGRDGGGAGSKSGAAIAGAANTGGGGGGASLSQRSGDGGTGILILRKAI